MNEEKIKEFFKPTGKKIILIYFLNLIGFIILTSYFLLSSFRLRVGPLQILWDLFLSIPLRLSSIFMGFGPQIPVWIYFVLSFMIYWYLISCTIVWVYDKVKKK